MPSGEKKGSWPKRRRGPQRNVSECPTCGAKKGQPCTKAEPGGGHRTMQRTHRWLAASRQPGGRTAKRVSQVAAEVEALGPIVPVAAAETRPDGSPRLGPGQVYAMPFGTVYHPAWCSAVGERWDAAPGSLTVIDESTVGGRRACRLCEDPLTT